MCQRKHKKNIMGTASHGTQLFLELLWNTLRRFLRRLRARSLKKLSQDFSMTEPRILGALSRLDEVLLKSQIWTLSGTIPGTSRKVGVKIQETTGDRSKNDPHPAVESSVCQSRNSIDSDPKNASHNGSITLCAMQGARA